MRYLIILFSAFCLINCNRAKERNTNKYENSPVKKFKEKKKIAKIETSTPIDTLEIFKDSLNFGYKKKSKIIIIKIGNEDSTFVHMNLFKKQAGKWIKTDSLNLENIYFPQLYTEIKDFNNDGFKDIIFTSGTAMRGGNNIQTLILYSPKSKSLNWIKNSEDYPNLLYNKKLDCIDSLVLTGGETTYFLKIKNDSLKEFAKVNHRDGIITSEILESNKKWKVIKSIKDQTRGLKRFIDYNPIEELK